MKTYIIGEIGLNHNGSKNNAIELINIANSAGCDAVKFQKRTVSQMATKDVLDAPFYLMPDLGSTYRQVRENLEFSFDEYSELNEYTHSLGMDFIVTPFDIPSLDFIIGLNIDAIKIASHSLTDIPLIKKINESSLPIILSTGMCTYQDIKRTTSILNEEGRTRNSENGELIILHCNSQYPVLSRDTNLLYIKSLKKSYPNHKIGFSDHQNGIHLGPVAVALGAEVLEKHITIDRGMKGFDHNMSLEPYGLMKYVRNVRETEEALELKPKYVMQNELDCFVNYRRTIVSKRDIKRGEIINREMLTTKAPNIGLKPNLINHIIGKKASKDIEKDKHLAFDDFYDN